MNRPPAGFELFTRTSPFIELIGPLFERRDGDALSLGLSVGGKHTNRRGICHGGVLATLADVALGYAMADKVGAKGFVTAQLALDYAGAAKLGDWVESDVEVQHAGSRLAFANCYLKVGEQRIVRASAIFAVTGAPKR
jgi:uncharacterized protein (TIGR00369 family)